MSVVGRAALAWVRAQRGCEVSRVCGAGAAPLQSTPPRRRHAAVAAAAAAESTEHADAEWQTARTYDEIPGPKPLPVIGNVWRFLPGIGDLYDENFVNQHVRMQAQYGDLIKVTHIAGRRDLLFVFQPDDIAKVFRTEGVWPTRPAFESLKHYRTVTRKELFGGMGGILTSQGKAWQEARSQVNPVLMQMRTVQLYALRINQVAQEFLDRIPEWRNEKNEMPETFLNELHKWALESIAVIALDTRLGCLAPGLAPDSEPQRMIDAVQTMFQCMHVLETRSHIWKLIPTRPWRKFVVTLDFFVDVCMKYITRGMDELRQNGPREDASVLERFLIQDPNPNRVAIMAIDMLFAGVDTTSYSLVNALLLLAANKEKQEKLHKEVMRVVPDPKMTITTDMLNEMKYLRAVIKESMRLLPIASGNIRTSQKEIVLSNYRIPKGIDIVLGNAAISREERNFPHAKSFIPERWLRQREGQEQECPFPGTKPHPFVSLPFGHGARKCVGIRFAALEMEIMLAKMVRQFSWEYNYGEMRYKSTMLELPVDPLRFAVTPRT